VEERSTRGRARRRRVDLRTFLSGFEMVWSVLFALGMIRARDAWREGQRGRERGMEGEETCRILLRSDPLFSPYNLRIRLSFSSFFSQGRNQTKSSTGQSSHEFMPPMPQVANMKKKKENKRESEGKKRGFLLLSLSLLPIASHRIAFSPITHQFFFFRNQCPFNHANSCPNATPCCSWMPASS
jgi:hypothetical protein